MKQRILTLVSILVLVTTTFGAGYFAGTQQSPAVAQDTGARDEFVPVYEAWDLLHEFYVDPLENSDLIDAMLTGLMEAAGDPNTDYMNPERYNTAREDLTYQYEGIGATVQQDEETGTLTIVRPLPGSPAEAAGLLPGDEVVTVDGEDITDYELAVIISLVKGPAGTDVMLGVRRSDAEELIEIPVTRERIELPSMEYEIIEQDDAQIAYVLLYSYTQNADEELRDALEEMDVESLDGMILDVRGNTGGYLDTTLEIISMFVEEGTIFIERGPNGENKIQAFGSPIAPTVPMVLLVDGFSASASELTTGALQDYDRATVIGTQTYGKGSVQTWRELSNEGGIRITISRWFTPAGRSVEPDGLTPDIELEYIMPEEGELYDRANDNQIQAALDYLINDAVPESSGPVAAEIGAVGPLNLS